MKISQQAEDIERLKAECAEVASLKVKDCSVLCKDCCYCFFPESLW